MYHAINPIEKETLVETWKFERKETEPRRTRLTGRMLLGKVPSKFKVEDITELLRKVRVPSPEDAQKTNWRCYHWVIDALELLEAEGVIEKLPSSPNDALNTGRAFVEAETNGNPVYGELVCTCDTSGKEIASEIEPLVVD